MKQLARSGSIFASIGGWGEVKCRTGSVERTEDRERGKARSKKAAFVP